MTRYVNINPAASVTVAWQVTQALLQEGTLHKANEGTAIVVITKALATIANTTGIIKFDEEANDALYRKE